jgi:hypothetical protein
MADSGTSRAIAMTEHNTRMLTGHRVDGLKQKYVKISFNPALTL